jgi:hypothetical protein
VTDPVTTGHTFARLAAGIPVYYLTAGRRAQQQRVGPSA